MRPVRPVDLTSSEAAAVAVIRAAVACELRSVAISLGLSPPANADIDDLKGLLILGACKVDTRDAVRLWALPSMIEAAAEITGGRSLNGRAKADVLARRAAWYVIHSEGVGGPSIASHEVHGKTWDASTVWDGCEAISAALRSGHPLTTRAVHAARHAYMRSGNKTT